MTYEPKGIRFFDAISNRQMILVAEGESFAGWLCYRHPDGQWVSLRKANEDDIAKINAAQQSVHSDAGDSAAFLNLFYPIFNLLNQVRRDPPQRR